MNPNKHIALRVVLVCLCLFGSQMVVAELLPEFLTEFRQFPLGITTEEFLHRFPDARNEGAVYLRKISCQPFYEVAYQFEKGHLIAVMLSPGSDKIDEAGWITQWSDTVIKAAEETWGKPDRTIITQYGESLDFARIEWAGQTSRVKLTSTTAASLSKASTPTSNVKPFILALVHNRKVDVIQHTLPHLMFCPAGAMVETPVVTELPEIPAKYCGAFYLHGKDDNDSGVIKQFSPAKAFGRIEAKRITLDGEEPLTVKSITQIDRSSLKGILMRFEKKDFAWGITEMPDSTLRIMQIDVHLKLPATTFIVSQKQ